MSKIPTRVRLIRAATTLFQRYGYAATGTNEILANAKAPRGSLYHHFPGGKADLAYACVDLVTEDVVEEIRRLRLMGKKSAEVLKSLALGTAKWLEEKEWQEGPLLPAFIHEFSASDELMMTKIRDSYSRIQTELVQMLMVEGAEKEDAAIRANNMLAILTGAEILSRALKSSIPLQNCTDIIGL
ncbi:MAG: TetR/AcrR family transcriptional regulator [Methyloligellaceae bacterium]